MYREDMGDKKSVKNKGGYPRGVPKEVSISASDSEVMQMLVGEKDKNLRVIQKELEVSIGRHQDSLVVSGLDAQVDLAHDLLSQLKDLLLRGEELYPGDVERAIKMLSENRKARLEDLFRDQIKISGRRNSIVPKTFHQKEYIDAITENDIVFGIGPAGTGKTYLAMAMAVSALLKKDVKRVVLCRPAVEAGEKLGFLPGDMAEKVNPYLRPLYDALHEMVDYERAQELIEKGALEVAPLAFMRGRTLTNAFVILDEAQNTTPVQMKMLLTRLGGRSKCVITGDTTQIDLPRGTKSGLIDALDRLKNVEGLSFIFFDRHDVMRHPLVARIVQAYEES
jgi:phosphate starvation-inducible protein PhoH and related proteins